MGGVAGWGRLRPDPRGRRGTWAAARRRTETETETETEIETETETERGTETETETETEREREKIGREERRVPDTEEERIHSTTKYFVLTSP